MSKDNQNNQSKKLFLSDEDKNNLQFRKTVSAYLLNLVDRDMQVYLQTQAFPKMEVDTKDSVVKLADDASYVEITPKLVLPDNGKDRKTN